MPVYLKVPLKKRVPPIHVSFNYFSRKNELVNPLQVDATVYISVTDSEPDKAKENVMVKKQCSEIVYGLDNKG